MSMQQPHNETSAKSTTRARQGVVGHGVRYVLVVGLAGAAAALAAVYLYFFA